MNKFQAVLLLVAALIYLLFPFDAVPDFVFILGWLDDVLVSALALYAAWRRWRSNRAPAATLPSPLAPPEDPPPAGDPPSRP